MANSWIQWVRPLDEHIEEMRNAAHTLVPYTYPLVDEHDDKVVSPLKQRRVNVDGYEVLVMFSRSDYGENFVENLEIVALYSPFLPMHVVCKLATRFLGGHHLLHYSSYLEGRKVYVWKVCLDRRGCPIPLDVDDCEFKEYQGLRFCYAP